MRKPKIAATFFHGDDIVQHVLTDWTVSVEIAGHVDEQRSADATDFLRACPAQAGIVRAGEFVLEHERLEVW